MGGIHLTHRIHQNSAAVYHAEKHRLGERALAILDWVRANGPATDRQIMRGLHFTDPNTVRPRVTELVDAGELVQCGTVICDFSYKKVRLVKVTPPPTVKLTQGALL